MTNAHLVLAMLAGLALLAMVYVMPSLKPAGIASVALVLAFIVWRQWGQR